MTCPRVSVIRIAAILLGVIVAAAAAVAAFATTKPDSFRVERSLTIRAPASQVFPLVNDLSAWEQWSPWANLDPAMDTTYSGAASGLGAVYEWSGNRDVGSGRMEIIDMTPPSTVRLRLDFIAPFASTNRVEFSFDPIDEYTDVTWRIDGPMPFLSKLISVFVSMDAMIGPDFETGLANLKALAER